MPEKSNLEAMMESFLMAQQKQDDYMQLASNDLVEFNLLKAAKFPAISDECDQIEVLDGLIKETAFNLDPKDPLEHLMSNNSTSKHENPEAAKCAQLQEASPPIPPTLAKVNHYKIKVSRHLIRRKLPRKN